MIPEALVSELRYVQLRAARRIRNERVGTYTSPLRGDGFDFDQHRPYRPGDDVRRIDWNATARFGTAFVKQTHAERELNVVVACDVSASMEYVSGRRSKREALMLATASILFSAAKDQINAGVLAFDDRVRSWLPPLADDGRAWTALAEVWHQPSRRCTTRVQPAIDHLFRELKRTTLVFVISDFLTDEALGASRQTAAVAARHDVVAVVLEDPAESRLPAGAGYVRLRDLESGRHVTVGLTDDVRRSFAAAVEQQRAALTTEFYRVGMDHVRVDTAGDVVEPLLQVFERRNRQ